MNICGTFYIGIIIDEMAVKVTKIYKINRVTEPVHDCLGELNVISRKKIYGHLTLRGVADYNYEFSGTGREQEHFGEYQMGNAEGISGWQSICSL